MSRLSYDALNLLPIETLRSSCAHNIRVPPNARNNKGLLVQHILQYHTAEQADWLLAHLPKVELGPCFSPPFAQRALLGGSKPSRGFLQAPPATQTSFPSVPSEDEKRQCMLRFYSETNNAATARGVCGICAREFRLAGEDYTVCPVPDLPHRAALVPPIPHPKHVLTDGLLLERRGLVSTESALACRICSHCQTQLRKPTLLGPMKYSLANNLWVGDPPAELATLSLPEQLLISLAYPRVFQFKLYCAGQFGGDGPFQKGLRGNVTTHPLDLTGLVDVAKGNRLPRPLAVLPTLIKITVVGQNQLDHRRLIPLFTVRRGAILRALLWMKSNNPKYYGNIDINYDVLNRLPPNDDPGDVPSELLQWVRQSEDVHAVHREEGGYVQSDGIEFLESDLSQVPDHRTSSCLYMIYFDINIGISSVCWSSSGEWVG